MEAGNFPAYGQEVRAQQVGVSDRTQRKLDYLARYAPDLLEKVRRRVRPIQTEGMPNLGIYLQPGRGDTKPEAIAKFAIASQKQRAGPGEIGNLPISRKAAAQVMNHPLMSR